MNLTLLVGIGGMTLFMIPLCAIPVMTLLRRQKRLRERLLAAQQIDGVVAETVVETRQGATIRRQRCKSRFCRRSHRPALQTHADRTRADTAGGRLSRRQRLGLFIGSKLLLVVLLPLAAFVLLRNVHMRPMLHIATVGGAAVIGLLSPDFVIRNMRQKYLKAVERGLADALDMMIICAKRPCPRGCDSSGECRDRARASQTCRGTVHHLGRAEHDLRQAG